jgi:nucleoid-associated protein YgaU
MADETRANDSGKTADTGERAGDFERYALVAALTLVVLCLILWDRWHAAPEVGGVGAAPAPDRALRVSIGGGDAETRRPPQAEKPHVSIDAPASPAPAPVAPPPAAAAPRTYVVKSGDSLYDIAKSELGSSSRVQEIVELNGLADASKLKIGQSLKLPPK